MDEEQGTPGMRFGVVLLCALLVALAAVFLLPRPADRTDAGPPSRAPAGSPSDEPAHLSSSYPGPARAASAASVLRVLDDEGNVPAGAVVRTWSAEDGRQKTAPGEGGECRVRGAPPFWVDVAAPGHVRRIGVLRSHGVYSVRIPRAATLTVLFRDHGAPVPGEVAILEPPARPKDRVPRWIGTLDEQVRGGSGDRRVEVLARGLSLLAEESDEPLELWEDAPPLRRTSDAAGRCEWKGLVPGSGYRWRCRGRLAAAVVPPHELRGEPGGPVSSELDELEPPGLSGAFDLEPGRSLELVVDGGALGGFLGILPEYIESEYGDAFLAVYREDPMVLPDGSSGWSSIQIARVGPDAHGVFLVEGLRPGPMSYSAHWTREEVHSFAHGYFEAEAGRVHEEILRSIEGHAVRGRVRFLLADGGELGREDLAGDREVTLQIASHRDVPRAQEVTMRFPATFGEPFAIEGLAAGTYRVAIVTPGDWSVLDATDLEPVGGPFFSDFVVPDQLDWSLDVPCRPHVRVDFRVDPDPASPAPGWVCQLVLVDAAGRRWRAACTWHAERGAFLGTERMVPGEYAVAGRIWHKRGTDPGLSYMGSVAISPGMPTLQLGFEPGAAVRGVVADLEGRPAPGELVVVRPRVDPWLDLAPNHWPWMVSADSEGRFFLAGLPPGVPLEVYRMLAPWGSSPAAGNTEDWGTIRLVPR